MLFRFCLFASMSMLHWLANPCGWAGIVTSTDRDDFTLTAESFDYSGFTTQNLTSNSGGLLLAAAINVGDPPTVDHGYLDFTSLMAGNEYVLNGDENFDVQFGVKQSAFAFDYLDDSISSTFTLSFYDDNVLVGQTSFSTDSPFREVKFIGFISSMPFNMVQFREADGAGNTDEYFQFYTATAVPEPSSLLLLVISLSIGSQIRRGRVK